MIGKTRIWQVRAALTLCLIAAPALAVIPVQDPISYTYYVQQLKKMQDTLKTGQQSLQQIQDMNAKMTGDYNRAAGMLREMQDTAQGYIAVPNTLANDAQQWATNAQELTTTRSGNPFVDARVAMDSVFRDPRDHTTMTDPTAHDREVQVRQSAIRDAIVTADGMLAGIPKHLQTITTLANAIDHTANLKDAQDLNNRIMVEILKTVTQLLNIDSRLVLVEGMTRYQGVSEAVTTQRLQSIQAAQTQVSGIGSGFEAILRRGGVDPTHKVTDADLKKLLGVNQ